MKPAGSLGAAETRVPGVMDIGIGRQETEDNEGLICGRPAHRQEEGWQDGQQTTKNACSSFPSVNWWLGRSCPASNYISHQSLQPRRVT